MLDHYTTMDLSCFVEEGACGWQSYAWGWGLGVRSESERQGRMERGRGKMERAR